jgi:SAM-dependent methyltransferase
VQSKADEMNVYRSVQERWRRVPERYRIRLAAAPLVRRSMSWLRNRYASHDELYNAPYFSGVDKHAMQSAGAIAESIVADFAPARVADVGCGTGALLAELQSKGLDVRGLEYSEAALDYCRSRGLNVQRVDLEGPVSMDVIGRCEVAVSQEVAEHLPARVAGQLVELLCQAERAVVFSAAGPGQGGSDHVNEQPPEYWVTRFEQNGFVCDYERTERWRTTWAERGVRWWYYQNLLVFVRAEPTLSPRP